MKKSIGFLMLLITMIVLAACGNSGGEKKAGENVTLKYGMWNKDQVPAVEKIIENFEKANPTIKVEIELTPREQYFQKLETAANGGAMPDVFWMNGPNVARFANGKALLPLTDLVKKDKFEMSNYPETLTSLYTINDDIYGVPKDFDTTGLFYNKKIFDEAGVPYPDETWTWEDLKEAAVKLTNKEAGIYGIAAELKNQGSYYDLIWQNGGEIITKDGKSTGFADPAVIEALEYWYSFTEEGASPTYAQLTETRSTDMFMSGKLAMTFDGSWRVAVFKDNPDLDVAPLPQGKERAVTIHGLANVISAKTKNQEAAWTFVKYLGSKDAAQVFAETGTVIPALNGMQEAWLESVPTMNLQVFIDALEYSHPLPNIEQTSALWAEETNILKKAFSGEISVEDAAKELAASADKILNK
ncbi:multiple sugar transport system substrate-binding protein [Neobacillus niacini]|uniref:ABC transporter substrate-binding protein n=1 Tax=Neobacillus niacini TaxID=86668 RepID=UPI0028581BF5|nr:sugar ABC transporter substrate-binding protein [Neobacillus niacini]MDR7079485.1 multiple sugar transport system substrate-binding protein [Neobacillus niacini]